MRTFMEWKTLYELDPWGERRDDLRMAMATYRIVSPHLTKRAARKFTVKDCLFVPPIDVTEQDPQDTEAKAQKWAQVINGSQRNSNTRPKLRGANKRADEGVQKGSA